MEKKTIGSFIAALRRANGLTQKELAEKLNEFFANSYADGSLLSTAEKYGVQAAVLEQ